MTRQTEESGFTLLELLSVMVIMSLMVALLPRMQVGLERARLGEAADRLVAQLAAYQEIATQTGLAVTVAFDIPRKRYGITGGRMQDLGGVVRTVELSAPQGMAACQGRVRFFSDGGASACQVHLIAAHSTRSINIDWLTGRISRLD